MSEYIGSVSTFTSEVNTGQLEHKEFLNRDEAIAALDSATDILKATLEAIPQDDALEKTAEHPRFGDLGARGWLILIAVHEQDHVQQLQSLDPR